ncbi:amino acid adenylation domain-containing protein [Streptomyces sp. 71268]|uniref:non-ribosomal peptide synthetase n=1 Tax=Streptomyces sp. 71268 TaxID=3002640 RepID=UPI0023F977E2|nr:amino acid adenylation domain-containing protein [Streptomyces sp. 71268]WEV28754.1 amino acid adenylation domain-containing protein [Streptomyces sp. 71268]
MSASMDDDREYWRKVLTAGGFTAIPRWTPEPVTGVADQEAEVPDDLAAALRRRADEMGVPPHTLLLAAHARVLAALSGERTVGTGYATSRPGPALPCRLTTAPGTWRELVARARDAEAELLAHQGCAVADLARELGLDHLPYESELDLTGSGGELAPHTVLRVAARWSGERLALWLRYRTDVLDAEYAARVAGYHHTALAQLAADPDAEPARQSLLSAAEHRYQLEELAGPNRPLPDRRFHQLFEERVRAHPEAVAAVHGDRQWTYRELNARANHLGRALLARGLGREGVVAVFTERDLDWMAAVIAVFKAGGVYLPVEPHLPADRIAAMLSRAACTLALTGPGTTGLDPALEALPAVRALPIEAAYAEEHAEDNLGVEVGPDQLAYIYFTSGSTGEPKGAMCEHAGMLNHLYAKIADLGIGPGQVVAQTAPQGFDISLWQLVSALLVDGRTHLVEQRVILDVQRFVDTLVEARVNVLQVVPSYLEAVLTDLERRPRPLPDLRCVSVTGEALKKEIAHRWFAAQPGIRLVNAYGLTETSDDTNHEVMDRAPEGDRVPLGPCVNNVRVYVVDEHLSPVPLGAPGEIVFAGVCVGRGYVNDPERTRLAFRDDPYHPGQRLYRGGDFGRWLPGGKLDFLGRRDAQVKIRGFRIEIGDIESALLRVPGVRDGAVVVAGQDEGQTKRLVAFCAGPHAVAAEDLRDRLRESLPAYMVPTAFHWRDRLPLTANGKVDKKALTALAAERTATTTDNGQHAPHTPTERRLAQAWTTVLGIPTDRIGRRDHFFDLGGTSLSAVKLAIALDRAVSLNDLTRHPVLADLAALVDGRTVRRPGLLHPLAEPEGEPTALLVCFPYAGGNAVNFRPMATALRAGGLAVEAVELPGHDLAAERAPFAPLEEVVEQVVAELAGRRSPRLLLWGHSSGAAPAIETARGLEARGIPVHRVFVGAQLLGEAPERRAAITELAQRSNAQITKELSADTGYSTLDDLDARHGDHIGAAYRHDCVAAHRYFTDLLEHPPADRLTTPLTAVVAADDPITADATHRHHTWRLLADRVELRELADGGHYFPRTRPADAAQAVLRALQAPDASVNRDK